MLEKGNLVHGILDTRGTSLKSEIAERAIYQTFCDYLTFVDNGQDYPRAVRSFSEDASIEYHMNGGAPLTFNGRENFLSYLEGQPSNLHFESCVHVVGQVAIQWTDRTPKLSAYVTAWHWFSQNKHLGKARPADWPTIGFVEDEFQFRDRRWLISRRVLRPAAGLVATGSPPGTALK